MTDSARLYGGSLYDLAAQEGLTDQLMEETAAVDGLFRENEDYIRLLSEPSIARTERLGLLDKAFGGQAHPYLLNFLKILCENGMMREYSGCCKEYRRRYNEANGIAEAVVTSAIALTESQKKALVKKLESTSGKKILLTERVNPGILGGLRVEFEGKQMDGTIEGRLSGLRKLVTSASAEGAE
ncbi:MAG: ATP synthase F1 subunit delta [Clostridiales bacterium]|nr:ATP synthase F1 subunit delta [Clostridiales bacterium]